jgi:hypothetical protein
MLSQEQSEKVGHLQLGAEPLDAGELPHQPVLLRQLVHVLALGVVLAVSLDLDILEP